MTEIIIDHKDRFKDNLRKTLNRHEFKKRSNELIKDSLRKALGEHKGGAVFMVEIPVEAYFETNATSLKFLLNEGYEGIYLSFQRPFKNLFSLFKEYDINLDKLMVIDGASAFSGQTYEDNPRCINISSDMEIDKVVEKIYSSLINLKCDKKFVFVDSLTTMALHEPMAEASRLPEFLVETLREKGCENVAFIFNVAEDLTKKSYIEDIAVYADEFIHLGLCT